MKSLGILALALLTTVAAGPARAQTALTPAQRSAAEAARDACKADFARFCTGVRPGGGRILQCLDAHAGELSPLCRAALPQARQLRAAVPDPAK